MGQEQGVPIPDGKGGYRKDGSGNTVVSKLDEPMLKEIAKAGEGIYITECKGFHAGANAVTGDFSIESAGFLIENGKIGAPIKSFTVAGNFFELLKSISAMSDKVEVAVTGGFTTFGAPAVLIKDMSVEEFIAISEEMRKRSEEAI